ncbi:hypothetical protein Vadar_024729 [Vaccinium darrowii]|uniref:Uncharacterized protein n=1 Tax=Vaccinium darrowii TaxID=229202 RepID=A0ACB7YFV8_9ERIC|nr:hypothetical protein Vadar_024729 [Vaccinium darrowii]
MKNRKDDSPAAATSKFKKKLNKVTDRKIWSNGSTFLTNGSSEYGEYASDRELRKRLSRLNKKSMDSGSETTDERDRTSEEPETDTESSASDSESDLDFHTEKVVGESRTYRHFISDDGLDSLTAYAHNLLLDSLPEGSDWSLQDKHVFIEDVIIHNLNEQAQHFTGTGTTPMKYPLQPIIEEILETAELIMICGLGVVCNKEVGIGEDDYVVEFLGQGLFIRSSAKQDLINAPQGYIEEERKKETLAKHPMRLLDELKQSKMGIDIANFEARMLAMTKPTNTAIVQHAKITKPAIVFVPTRKHARYTAVDLMMYSSVDSGENLMLLKQSAEELEPYLSRIKEPMLSETM